MDSVLLLGLFDTAIMTARCFKKTGIKIYGMDYNDKNAGFHSRIINSVKTPDPRINEMNWFNFVLEWLRNSKQSFVLIPTSDEFVELTAKYYLQFSKYCLALIPSYQSINNIIQRDIQFKIAENCGLHVPYFIKNRFVLYQNLHSNLRFPVAVKPINVNEWKKKLNTKGFIIQDEKELYESMKILESKKLRFLVQNIIDGDNTLNYEVNSLYLPDGKLIQHSIRKLRQYPDRYGTSTCIEQSVMPELEKHAGILIKHLKLYGFSNIEFKLDPHNHIFYYIETNPRVWLQINFSMSLGMNFPLLYYKYLTEKISSKKVEILTHGKWVDFSADIFFWYKYHKIYSLSLYNLVKSWFPIKATALFSFTDPLPYIKDLRISEKIRNVFKKSLF